MKLFKLNSSGIGLPGAKALGNSSLQAECMPQLGWVGTSSRLGWGGQLGK